MADLSTIKEAARIVSDEHGMPVVQIPLALWEEIVKAVAPGQLPQHERIRATLQAWETEQDEMPDEWWDEFSRFLRENRVQFTPRDQGM